MTPTPTTPGTDVRLVRTAAEVNALVLSGEWELAGAEFSGASAGFAMKRVEVEPGPRNGEDPAPYVMTILLKAAAAGAGAVHFSPNPKGMDVWFDVRGRMVFQQRIGSGGDRLLERHLRRRSGLVDDRLSSRQRSSITAGSCQAEAYVSGYPTALFIIEAFEVSGC